MNKVVEGIGSVNVVVVTYNRPVLLKECLDAIADQSYECNEVFVIDNGGFETTRKVVESEVNRLNINHQVQSENLGGAGGFSEGIRLASMEDVEFVWVMDDDTKCDHLALEKLMKSNNKLKNSGIMPGILVSNVRWKNGDPAVMNVPNVKNGSWNASVNTDTIEVSSASFVSMLIRRDAIISVGLPIAEFFIWGDDTEYSLRISRKKRAFFVMDSFVEHLTADNIGVDVFKEQEPSRIKRYEYDVRNQFYIKKRYFGKKGLAKHVLSTLIKSFRVLGTRHGGEKMVYLLRGLIKGPFFSPKIKYVK